MPVQRSHTHNDESLTNEGRNLRFHRDDWFGRKIDLSGIQDGVLLENARLRQVVPKWLQGSHVTRSGRGQPCLPFSHKYSGRV